MAKKNINSRVDGVTKDVVPGKPEERVFRFPSLGVEVKAETYQEALAKAKEVIKK